MSIANGYSYEYQNLIRSLTPAFTQLVKSFPFFLSLVPIGGEALATKHEWLEDSLSPSASTIGSFDTDGDGTGVNLISTAGIRAGSLLRFATVADVTRTEIVQVASVDSGTDLTIVRDYGGSTGVTLVVGDKCYLVSSPQFEKSNATASAGSEPVAAYNYTQIFDRTADISATAQAVKIYGMSDALDYQVQNKMKEIMWELNNAIIYGRRVIRASSVRGSMGGLLQFMEGGNIDTTAGNLTKTILNNMLEMIFQDGSFSNNYAILCSENQARRISAFNTTGSNPIIIGQDGVAGGSISRFIGDLPIQSGFTANIVVDPNFPRDQVAIVDLNNIALVPLAGRELKDMDATTAGMDGAARRILGEYTLQVMNGTKAHALATGLNV